MSILQIPHAHPTVILFDWHATLADTMDAMYYALDDVMPRLRPLGLIERLVPPGRSKTLEDEKLVKYVREHSSLHPKVRAERKISRTDIFEVLFGDDQEAKARAHQEFDRTYEQHFGAVRPMEAGARQRLQALKDLGVEVGVLSNRARRFMAHELYMIDGDGWHELVDTMVCGDDVARRKPHPDLVLKALDNLGRAPGLDCWYVGDSTTDVIAAKRAGVTSVFYNGVGWDRHWLDKIFPGTVRHPHVPDAVVGDLPELLALARRLIAASAEQA
ncbi:HAD family hydrolase [Solimonas marina]|uniref:phosphoglycolate phosphatase n=1 Tax=Solimonas marina TaxID=2714601 RepID=A0A969WBV7_9GAMM|nr:HAD-IA family hydrolase [Solimonas marina]NKF23698.1 HAD-IA family hydrolase [Solimonas marina]